MLVDAEGRYGRYFAGYSATGEYASERRARAIRDMYDELERRADVRLVQVRLRGYLIEFFASDGRLARYAFVLPREEPFELPPIE